MVLRTFKIFEFLYKELNIFQAEHGYFKWRTPFEFNSSIRNGGNKSPFPLAIWFFINQAQIKINICGCTQAWLEVAWKEALNTLWNDFYDPLEWGQQLLEYEEKMINYVWSKCKHKGMPWSNTTSFIKVFFQCISFLRSLQNANIYYRGERESIKKSPNFRSTMCIAFHSLLHFNIFFWYAKKFSFFYAAIFQKKKEKGKPYWQKVANPVTAIL